MLTCVKLAIAAPEPRMFVRSKLVCAKPCERSGASVFADPGAHAAPAAHQHVRIGEDRRRARAVVADRRRDAHPRLAGEDRVLGLDAHVGDLGRVRDQQVEEAREPAAARDHAGPARARHDQPRPGAAGIDLRADPVEAQLDALIEVQQREQLGELILAAPVAQADVDDHAAVIALAEAPRGIVDDHLDDLVREVPVADPADRIGPADRAAPAAVASRICSARSAAPAAPAASQAASPAATSARSALNPGPDDAPRSPS